MQRDLLRTPIRSLAVAVFCANQAMSAASGFRCEIGA